MKNQETERTEMVFLKFFTELDNLWPARHAYVLQGMLCSRNGKNRDGILIIFL